MIKRMDLGSMFRVEIGSKSDGKTTKNMVEVV